MTYEGWKNRQTWNVSLWLNNDYNMYTAAVAFMQKHRDAKHPYAQFIASQGMQDERTGDNIAWLGSRLDYKELDDMMRELVA